MKANLSLIGPAARALLFAASVSGSALIAAAPAELSYGFDQVVKMHDAGVSDKLLTAYVESAKHVTAPKAEEILYLHERGVSEQVILAALQKAPPPVESAPSANATATPVGSYVPPAPQPTVVYAQPATAYAPPVQVYVAPPVVNYGYGYNCGYNYGYNYGYCSPYYYQPHYYAQAYNYYHYPRVYPTCGTGVSFGYHSGGYRSTGYISSSYHSTGIHSGGSRHH